MTEFLRRLRLGELRAAVAHFPAKGRVLEVGAGAGWQALELERLGYRVAGVDLPTSLYARARVFPVIDYDGVHLPFTDSSFDVVFSSNVLEHVEDLVELQSELRRVLSAEGTAVHVVPTPCWRLWTTLAFPLHLLRTLVRRVGAGPRPAQGTAPPAGRNPARLRGARRLLRVLTPARHGETGNVLTELYHFSHARWARLFRATGWRIVARTQGRLAYTGYAIFGPRLSLRVRRMLSHVLGSACRLYVLRPTKENACEA